MKLYGLFILLLCALLNAEAKRSGSSPDLMRGKGLFEAGHYAQALGPLSASISKAKSSSERNLAYYYQGLALFELKLYYSSYISFRNVLLNTEDENKKIYEKAIKNSVIIADRLRMVERVGKILDKLPASFVATTVSDMTHYAIGVHHAFEGDTQTATSRLKSVHPESSFYNKALFQLGVLATREKNYKDALYYFQKVDEQTTGIKKEKALNELARLNHARTAYAMGDLDRAVRLYSRFSSSSAHWVTILLEASWPLMRLNDATVSLGNLHTLTSPYYYDDLVGEAYVLRATILFALCKYEEMRRTLAVFFDVYVPVLKELQASAAKLDSPYSYYEAYAQNKVLSEAFLNYLKRDESIDDSVKVLEMLRKEQQRLSTFTRNSQMRRMKTLLGEADKALSARLGAYIKRLHERKINELQEHREQANYLKVEILTGEKELIEAQQGLPPVREVDVETTVAENFVFWPYRGEYWEDELGSYVYTTESACVN